MTELTAFLASLYDSFSEAEMQALQHGHQRLAELLDSGTVPDDTLVDVETAVEHVGDGADYVLTGQPEGTSRASTILSLADGTPGAATVLRRGDITAETLETAAQIRVD